MEITFSEERYANISDFIKKYGYDYFNNDIKAIFAFYLSGKRGDETGYHRVYRVYAYNKEKGKYGIATVQLDDYSLAGLTHDVAWKYAKKELKEYQEAEKNNSNSYLLIYGTTL